ncbi:sugar phosphate isomerase/epimerase family protein [Paenibacillus oceani]|uniref:Sugar phosphate isomerase/epimerase n=1 Tax=Paenibacillus oceani TaxID=2772510 RepID=A0A927GZQ3_9BACL|nr:sugar phosphate isomerase/epimerase [Paenibacillus oceani]MBD2862322.1 sugar phosphate isomerase/epimerase [Paenibacillus oceani]
MTPIPVGLQLFTLRNELKDDFDGVIRQVAEIGFKTLEFAGYYGKEAGYIRKLLDDTGLRAVSAHVSLPLLRSELSRQIEQCLEIGASYLVCPSAKIVNLTEESDFQAMIDEFRLIGSECARQGLTFAYHNHAFEFEQIHGEYILDRIYNQVEPHLLHAELDLYWIRKAGLDPLQYLLANKGRCPLVHVKDMADDDEGTFAEVGEGIIDYPAIFAAAAEAGVQHYIVEQDKCERHSPLRSIEISMRNLQAMGVA